MEEDTNLKMKEPERNPYEAPHRVTASSGTGSNPLRLRLVELRHEMAVAIEGRLNGGITQLRLDVLRVGAVSDQEAGVGMAEVVEAHPAEGSAPESLRKLPVTGVIRIEGRPSVATEDELTASCG